MDIRQQRIDAINELREKGINPFPYSFKKDMSSEQIQEKYDGVIQPEQMIEADKISFAGRTMTIRHHGKSAFLTIKDDTGRIQAYIRLDKVGAEKYEIFKKYVDLGDWIGIEGFPFKTKTGELTILVENFELLSKSIRPIPEKWHGLKDREVKYRQRYVDMISNDDVIKTFRTRFEAIRLVREFMHSRNFVEVETPILESIMGGANARPFITHLNVFDTDMYLRIAQELHLKRLVVGGMERVFELGRNFRNEGVSFKHNPEFTTIEIYQAYADYSDMMELTENLLAYLAQNIHHSNKIVYDGTEIDFTPPFRRVDMRDFIKENLGVDILEDSDEKIQQYLKDQNALPDILDKSHYIDALWDMVESKLIQPTFVMHHPVEISPLAKRHRKDPRVTERFELIVYGREIANAFSELNDAVDQYERFKKQADLKEKGDDEAQMMDKDFVRALEYGLPPTGGLGIGIDRVAMFLTNSPTIRDVIAFPIVKPIPFEDEEKDFEEEQGSNE